MAIPLSVVARLEEFKAADVEGAGGQRVVQYRGQIMPLIEVADVLTARRPAAGKSKAKARPIKRSQRSATKGDGTLQVVVSTCDGQTVGLCVEQILDVVEEQVNLQPSGARTGVLGTAVIKEKVTELLDVPSFVRLYNAMTASTKVKETIEVDSVAAAA